MSSQPAQSGGERGAVRPIRMMFALPPRTRGMRSASPYLSLLSWDRSTAGRRESPSGLSPRQAHERREPLCYRPAVPLALRPWLGHGPLPEGLPIALRPKYLHKPARTWQDCTNTGAS